MTRAEIFDVIGIGFGPSNLSLAVAIDERTATSAMKSLFLEKKPAFQWHPDMLLRGADMQISFLKDIVTLRNPSSKYTFLNYLKEKGRLLEFINIKKFYPSRIEFNDYLTWVAQSLGHCVRYGYQVVSINPHGEAPHRILEVVARDIFTGVEKTFMARNIVVAPGGVPNIPFEVQAIDVKRVWHSSQYLNHIEAYTNDINRAYNFSVVGRGQSAAEICKDLYNTFPNATITCLFRGFSLKPADESEFVNEIFSPSFVDGFYNMKDGLRAKILDEYKDTNYSVVDPELISELYGMTYNDKVTGAQRLFFKNMTDVTRIESQNDQVFIHAQNIADSPAEALKFDAVILATGYKYLRVPSMLKNLRKFMATESTEPLSVDRTYRLKTTDNLLAGIYLQGCNEETHGISDTLLSILPVRSQEVLDDILSKNWGNLVNFHATNSNISDPEAEQVRLQGEAL